MEFLYYLLKVSFLTMVFFGVYHLLLRKETFFNANRYFLLSSLVVSFILPLINIPLNNVSGSVSFLPGVVNLPTFNESAGQEGTNLSNGISVSVLAVCLYAAGSLFIIIRSIFHTLRLSKIRFNNPSTKKGNIRIIYTDRIPSFSFFRWIFIKSDSNDEAQQSVLKHELAHASQFHSADLIILEFAQAVLWFNPFIHLYRKSVLETHEFLADRVVLRSGTDLRDYVDTIVEEIMHNQSYKLASHFKSSTLKKRVIMATKQSSKKAGYKYLLILPALVFGLLSFSFTSNNEVPQDKGKKNLPAIWPLEKSDIKKISRDFGGSGDENHPGIDFVAKTGTPVVATASGYVKAAKEKGAYGNIVYLVHDDHCATLYAHLDKFKVKEGMKVKKGDVIGTVGSTGKSTGPHLHYEVMIDGKSVNPKKVMEKAKILAQK